MRAQGDRSDVDFGQRDRAKLVRYDSMAVICARILERHRSTIRVRKEHVATANLTQIIGAVLKLSSRKGFHETSLRDLAHASGLSMSGMYSYFAGKDALLTMILVEVATTSVRVLKDPPGGLEERPREHLQWLIETHIRLTEAMQPWFAFVYMEAKGFPPTPRRMATESELATEAIFATVLEQGVRSGQFAIRDVGLAASLIKSLLQDWYVKRSKYRRRGTTVDEYIGGVVWIIERAILKR